MSVKCLYILCFRIDLCLMIDISIISDQFPYLDKYISRIFRMSDSRGNSRRNTENESTIEVNTTN